MNYTSRWGGGCSRARTSKPAGAVSVRDRRVGRRGAVTKAGAARSAREANTARPAGRSPPAAASDRRDSRHAARSQPSAHTRARNASASSHHRGLGRGNGGAGPGSAPSTSRADRGGCGSSSSRDPGAGEHRRGAPPPASRGRLGSLARSPSCGLLSGRGHRDRPSASAATVASVARMMAGERAHEEPVAREAAGGAGVAERGAGLVGDHRAARAVGHRDRLAAIRPQPGSSKAANRSGVIADTSYHSMAVCQNRPTAPTAISCSATSPRGSQPTIGGPPRRHPGGRIGCDVPAEAAAHPCGQGPHRRRGVHQRRVHPAQIERAQGPPGRQDVGLDDSVLDDDPVETGQVPVDEQLRRRGERHGGRGHAFLLGPDGPGGEASHARTGSAGPAPGAPCRHRSRLAAAVAGPVGSAPPWSSRNGGYTSVISAA